ncbi:MAG: histidine phosphatase family protein [Verrucomicrobiales bacterium]|nr:histidine phosphatase family protein [bacterium]MDF2378494.1 histidine phosphatase family protein [Verrucomicrobiales bacterium]
MKQLLLIRHAKSSWDFPGRSDHDRPLNDRGEHDAPAMAAALQQRGVTPDQIVTSSALRARTTAAIIAEGLGCSPEMIETESDLYLASPRTILTCVQNLNEASGTVLMFGHNPGMHEAVVRLTADPGVREFPTLAVARIEFDVEFWGEVDWNGGMLLELLTPKTLKDR